MSRCKSFSILVTDSIGSENGPISIGSRMAGDARFRAPVASTYTDYVNIVVPADLLKGALTTNYQGEEEGPVYLNLVSAADIFAAFEAQGITLRPTMSFTVSIRARVNDIILRVATESGIAFANSHSHVSIPSPSIAEVTFCVTGPNSILLYPLISEYPLE